MEEFWILRVWTFRFFREELDFLVLEGSGGGEPDGELIILALVLDLVLRGDVVLVRLGSVVER